MNAITCLEVEALIELYAAGECDAAERRAVERHLAACPGCARAHEEAQQTVGLLELHFREPEALRRLHDRIESDAMPRRSLRSAPLWQRTLAVAAMLLLTFGLASLLAPRGGWEGGGQVAVAWAEKGSRWTARGGEIELSEGELAVRSAEAVKVRTPGGVATIKGGECFIAVRPGARPDVRVAVNRGRVQLSNAAGVAEARAGEVLQALGGEAPRRQVEALALRFGRHYTPEPVKATPRLPTRPLPLDPREAVNYKSMAAAFPLAAAADTLKANGFAVFPGTGQDDVVAAYAALREREVPLVVTADAVLHLTRGQFDETLREIEERVFAPDLAALLAALLREVDRQPADTPPWRAARATALAYLAVGLKALEPDAALPKDADVAAVEAVLAAIRRHDARPVPVPLLGRAEDFSAYRPEGHYVRSERLKRYHAAMTWFSRAALLLGAGKQPLVAPADARRQTLAAALVARALGRAALPDGRKANDVWERIVAVTAFYVGLTDDAGPQQYRAALERVGGDLADEARLRSFKLELAKEQPTASAGARPLTPAALLERMDPATGFRLFGRRFTPDGYALERLVYPAVGPATREGQFTYGRTPGGKGVRAVGRGLDVMALLGSGRARELLHELGDDAYRAGDGAPSYAGALAGLQREFAELDDVDWNRNLYWSWLFALKPLLAERGTGYPPFMTSPAYRTKSLNTALASWAHRRQDAALYAKGAPALEMKTLQMVDIAPGRTDKPAAAHVEPLPEVYGRLLALTRTARLGLVELKVLDEPARARLARLEKLLRRLVDVAEKELAAEPLGKDEQAFLGGFVDELERTVAARDDRRLLKLAHELHAARKGKNEKAVAAVERGLLAEGYGALGTVSVVTVQQSVATGEVLQEATGLLDLGVFLFQEPGGKLLLGAGPVLSYYEFKRPRGAALTEVEWRRLAAGQAPERPVWTREYLVTGKGTR